MTSTITHLPPQDRDGDAYGSPCVEALRDIIERASRRLIERAACGDPVALLALADSSEALEGRTRRAGQMLIRRGWQYADLARILALPSPQATRARLAIRPQDQDPDEQRRRRAEVRTLTPREREALRVLVDQRLSAEIGAQRAERGEVDLGPALRTLLALHALGDNATQRAIRARVGLAEGTLRHHLRLLRDRGHVVMIPDPANNRRPPTYALTPLGRQTARDA